MLYETLIFRHLYLMSARDPFWRKCHSNTYTRQVAITKHINKGDAPKDITWGDDEERVKKWYKKQKVYWGYGQKYLKESLIQARLDELEEFTIDFREYEKRIEKLKGR